MTSTGTYPLLFLHDFGLDSGAEQEILSSGDMPLAVDIVFTDPARNPLRETALTEVHWFYNKGRRDAPMVALESDIEGTGQTLKIAEIAFMRVSGMCYTLNAKKQRADHE